MEYFQWGINTKMSVIAILTAEEGKWFIAYEIAETNTFRDNSCPFKVFFFSVLENKIVRQCHTYLCFSTDASC